jgi:amphi-Trp domain-containing protein
MKNILFKSKDYKPSKETAKILRQIADKIEKRKLTLKKGSQEISIDIPENVELEIKVDEKRKGDVKKTLEIEIEWKEGENKETLIA